MNIYKDGTHLATASVDKTVKLIDMQTLEVLKVYQTDRPANAVALSPIFDQVRSHLVCIVDVPKHPVMTSKHQGMSIQLHSAVHKAITHEVAC